VDNINFDSLKSTGIYFFSGANNDLILKQLSKDHINYNLSIEKLHQGQLLIKNQIPKFNKIYKLNLLDFSNLVLRLSKQKITSFLPKKIKILNDKFYYISKKALINKNLHLDSRVFYKNQFIKLESYLNSTKQNKEKVEILIDQIKGDQITKEQIGQYTLRDENLKLVKESYPQKISKLIANKKTINNLSEKEFLYITLYKLLLTNKRENLILINLAIYFDLETLPLLEKLKEKNLIIYFSNYRLSKKHIYLTNKEIQNTKNLNIMNLNTKNLNEKNINKKNIDKKKINEKKIDKKKIKIKNKYSQYQLKLFKNKTIGSFLNIENEILDFLIKLASSKGENLTKTDFKKFNLKSLKVEYKNLNYKQISNLELNDIFKLFDFLKIYYKLKEMDLNEVLNLKLNTKMSSLSFSTIIKLNSLFKDKNTIPFYFLSPFELNSLENYTIEINKIDLEFLKNHHYL